MPCRERYGGPLIALDLLRQGERRPREGLLAAQYAAATQFLNQQVRIGSSAVSQPALSRSHLSRATLP